MVFSIMLWMPSWGGMINGLMTLSGAWDKLRTDPVLRMMVVVDRLLRHGDLRRADDVDQGGQLAQPLHRLDHRPRAFRRARLGRHISFGAIYCLVPWLWERERLYSLQARQLALLDRDLGIVLYITAMWVSGIMQGLMWRAYDQLGFLDYSFVETVAAMHPFYVIRALGGVLFLAGALIMAFNVWQTIRRRRACGRAHRPAPRCACAGRIEER